MSTGIFQVCVSKGDSLDSFFFGNKKKTHILHLPAEVLVGWDRPTGWATTRNVTGWQQHKLTFSAFVLELLEVLQMMQPSTSPTALHLCLD